MAFLFTCFIIPNHKTIYQVFHTHRIGLLAQTSPADASWTALTPAFQERGNDPAFPRKTTVLVLTVSSAARRSSGVLSLDTLINRRDYVRLVR